MKSKIVNKGVEIDWSKPQILTYNKDKDVTIIVAYNGESSDDVFEGTVLCSNNYKALYAHKSWNKRSFKPLQGSVTIEFSND